MTEPYYSDDKVTLYLGDCRELLHLVQGPIDLVMADPPYAETSLAWDSWPDGWPAIAAGRASSMWCFGSMRMFLERRDEFTDWRLSQDVVWKKHRRSGLATDRFARVHEHALHWYRGEWMSVYHEAQKVPHYGKRVATARRAAIEPGTRGAYGASVWEDDGTRWQTTVIEARAMHRNGVVNETQKPEGVVEPLIAYGCPPGGLVVSLFGGSGTDLVAARSLGRRAVGFELREEQCEKAALRLAQDCLDLGGVS